MTEPVTQLDPKRIESLADAILDAAGGAHLGMSITFIDTPVPRIAFINDVGAKILGWPMEEILQMSAIDILSPENREDIRDRRARRAQIGPWMETTATTKDGRRVPLQIGMSPIQIDGRPAVVSFILDVSEQKHVLQEFTKSEERFRSLIELAPEAIWIFDGGLRFVNPAVVKMLRYPDMETVLKTNPLELVHEEDRPAMLQRSRHMFETGERMDPMEYRTWTYDRRLLTVEVHSQRIEWEGKPALICIGRDVSARKAMEARAAQSDRLAALGTLVAGISHEINNPLTFMLLGVEQATRALSAADTANAATTQQVRTILADVRKGAERVAAIVGQLRAFSRMETEKREPVSLVEVILSAAKIAENEIRHRARLVTHFSRDVPPVYGNFVRLEQVFLNLLVNAVHALPEGRSSSNEIRLSVDSGDGGVIAEVSDNGSGIAKDMMPHIFDPFVTTNAGGSSMGLGLSICHGIVTAHGGTIHADSIVDQGTTFRITLPASKAAVAAPPAAALPMKSPPVRRAPRVLVVDDEPGLAACVAAMIKDEYEVTFVNDGPTAWRHLTTQDVDVVLCDLMMPGMTGMDLYSDAVRLHPELPKRFIFMTGGAFSRRANDFLETVRPPMIQKPFLIADVVQAIERLRAQK